MEKDVPKYSHPDDDLLSLILMCGGGIYLTAVIGLLTALLLMGKLH